jgi:hypothetical protein
VSVKSECSIIAGEKSIYTVCRPHRTTPKPVPVGGGGYGAKKFRAEYSEILEGEVTCPHN